MTILSLVSSGVMLYVGWLVGTMEANEIFAKDKIAVALKLSSLLSVVSYLTGIGYEKLIFPYLGVLIVDILVVHCWIERAARRTTPPTSPGA